MSIMAEHMVDHPVHMEDLMNLHVDPDAAMVDPQLAMPYFANLNGKAAPDQMTLDPSMWQNPFDNFGSPAEPFNPFSQSQDNQTSTTADGEHLESVTAASSPSTTARTRLSGNACRTSSKSSVPSLSSSVSSPGKRTRSNTASKKEESNKEEPKKKATRTSRSRQKAKKEVAIEDNYDDEDDDDDDGGNDSKRNKYLERNRIAASKCRQKKKAWVSDLETQKSDLEAIHSNLQREYSSLVDQVTQLKNDLMAHAACGDQNIDSWIETEAKRFVQRTTDRSDDSHRRMSSGSAGRGWSHGESVIMGPSPAMSATGLPTSPIIKQEDINYDHMPDDMFN